MSVKPIDLQTNLAQMHEIAKNEHSKNTTLVDSQHILEKHSQEQANSVKNKLYENKEAEKTAIKKEENRKHKRFHHETNNKISDASEGNKDVIKDDRMGNLIDIKR